MIDDVNLYDINSKLTFINSNELSTLIYMRYRERKGLSQSPKFTSNILFWYSYLSMAEVSSVS